MTIDNFAAYPHIHVGLDGERLVRQAPSRIRVDPDGLTRLFEQLGAAEPDVRGPQDSIFLDTAHRYQYQPANPQQPDRSQPTFRVYQRI